MTVLLVSYDLRGSQGYGPFYEALKQQGAWWHYLTFTWLIATEKSPSRVYEALRAHLSQDDSILIIEVGNRYSGFLPAKAWDWIQQQTKAAAMDRWSSSPPVPETGSLPPPPREQSLVEKILDQMADTPSPPEAPRTTTEPANALLTEVMRRNAEFRKMQDATKPPKAPPETRRYRA